MAPARRARAFGMSLLLLVLAAPAAPARAWTWLPPGPGVPAPSADPREPSLGFDHAERGIWSARVGQAVVLGRSAAGVEATLDGMAWLWFTSLPRFNFPLETVDGTFGLSAGARGDRWSWRVRLAHWSGHLGDGGSAIEERRIVYSRESLTGLVFLDAGPRLRIHGGPGWFVRADPPTQAFQFQAGGEFGPRRGDLEQAGPRMDPYLAVDVRAKAENSLRLNQSYRAGLRLAGAAGGSALRVALGYDTGHSERGQEYRVPEHYVSLGCSFGR